MWVLLLIQLTVADPQPTYFEIDAYETRKQCLESGQKLWNDIQAPNLMLACIHDDTRRSVSDVPSKL